LAVWRHLKTVSLSDDRTWSIFGKQVLRATEKTKPAASPRASCGSTFLYNFQTASSVTLTISDSRNLKTNILRNISPFLMAALKRPGIRRELMVKL
jgi:hypothetical protein